LQKVEPIIFLLQETNSVTFSPQTNYSEFLASDTEVPGSIPGVTRFSE
jgi:hypothetical protein